MKIESLVLTDHMDKVSFHKRACELIKVEFPFNYFDESFIRAFKDENGKIIGGYVLADGHISRVLRSIPDQTKENLDINRIFEITGLWLDPSLRVGKLSAFFWLQISKDLSAQKDKDYFVYAYTLSNKKLKALYSLANPKVLYEGKVKQLEGNSGESYESVEIACKKTIKYLPIYGCLHFASKYFFSRKMYFHNIFHFRTHWSK